MKSKFDLISTKDLRRILKQTEAEIRKDYGLHYVKHGRAVKEGANWYAKNIEEFLVKRQEGGLT